jgi:hypothetical protein
MLVQKAVINYLVATIRIEVRMDGRSTQSGDLTKTGVSGGVVVNRVGGKVLLEEIGENNGRGISTSFAFYLHNNSFFYNLNCTIFRQWPFHTDVSIGIDITFHTYNYLISLL